MRDFAAQALRSVVNDLFRGSDAYEVVRTVLLWAVVVRASLTLRKIHDKVGVKRWAELQLMPWVKKVPAVRAKLESELGKMKKDLEKSMLKEIDMRTTHLPGQGMGAEELMKLLTNRAEGELKNWKDGKVTGAIYHGGDEHMALIGKVYAMFAYTNPLHSGLHPAVRQMDAEVVQMVVNMYNGDEGCCGAFMTGGTESIIMAMKSYRDWGRSRGITEPNIVVPVTAHAAVDKACQYFNITLRHARTVAPEHRVDLKHVRSLMDSNTVALFGSAPHFPTGSVDPIEELSELALRRGCGLHVDCCLGGFLVPFMEKAGFDLPRFDFRVPGVTTISCDPHKYGFAPKGSSVVMFRSHELRHHMYTFVTNWTGGIYATAGVLGSRPGGPVAATWASMVMTGEKGYVETAKKIVGATKKMAAGVRQIPELELLGRPDVCVVAFSATKESGLSTYSLGDCMREKRGWDLAALQNPPGLHLAVTLPSSENADKFVDDIRFCIDFMKQDKSGQFKGGTASMYGQAASFPQSIIEESVAVYLDTTMKATGPTEKQ